MVTTQLKTVEDLLQLEDDWPRFELIEGVLFEVPRSNPEHAFVLANLIGLIGSQVQKSGLGRAYAGGVLALLRRNPDTALGPDLAVVAAKHLPLKESAFMMIPPDWAIEVVSPGNTRREIERKTSLYLAHGVKSVWIVYPPERRVVVHTLGDEPQIFTDTAVITGVEPLTNVAIRVGEIFDD